MCARATPRRLPPGQDDAEPAPLPGLALGFGPPSVQLGEAPHEREPEAGPRVLAGEPRVELREGLEELREVFRGDARAVVPDLEPDEPGLLVARGRELHGPAGGRELHRVRQEVHEDLPYPPGVRDESDGGGGTAVADLDPLPTRLAPHDGEGRLADLPERAGVGREGEPLGADPGEVEDVGEEREEVVPGLLEVAEAPQLPLVQRSVDPGPEELGSAEDPRQRRPQLVAHAREERVLRARHPLQLGVHGRELRGTLRHALLQRGVQRRELGQCPLARGDVGDADRDRHNGPGAVLHGGVDRLEVKAPRLGPVDVRLTGERTVQALPHTRLVVLGDEGVEAVPERDLLRPHDADDAPAGRVEGEDPPLPVDKADQLRDRLQDRVEVQPVGRVGDLPESRLLAKAIVVLGHRRGV